MAKYNLLLDIKKRVEKLEDNYYIEDFDDNHGTGYTDCRYDVLELLDEYLRGEHNNGQE